MPVTLAARLRRSHFLFVGYEMADWNLRLVLNRVWGGRPVVYGSWAAQPLPSALERAFWRHYDVDVLDIEPDALVALLDARGSAAARRERARDRAVPRPQRVRRDRARRTAVLRARARDVEIVVANLVASRLTVLYGPSGVGKSSLLARGRRAVAAGAPEQPLVVVFRRWGDDPSRALADDVADGGRTAGGDGLVEVVRARRRRRAMSTSSSTRRRSTSSTTREGPAPSSEELAELVTAPLRVDVLLSIREDALAKLDRFKALIPNILGNYLRLDRLDRRAGERAIVGPLERCRRSAGQTVDDRAGARRTSARRGRRRPHHRRSARAGAVERGNGRRGSRRRSSSS